MVDNEDTSKSQARLNRGLADEYARWQRGKVTEARLAFDALLGENSFVEFWGRLAKMGGEGVNGGVPVDEDDDENEEGEGGGGKVDMKALAKNVDVSEMEKVLKVSFVFSYLKSWSNFCSDSMTKGIQSSTMYLSNESSGFV
jgi:hypothetical protein